MRSKTRTRRFAHLAGAALFACLIGMPATAAGQNPQDLNRSIGRHVAEKSKNDFDNMMHTQQQRMQFEARRRQTEERMAAAEEATEQMASTGIWYWLLLGAGGVFAGWWHRQID